jgi:hypothetical protein
MQGLHDVSVVVYTLDLSEWWGHFWHNVMFGLLPMFQFEICWTVPLFASELTSERHFPMSCLTHVSLHRFRHVGLRGYSLTGELQLFVHTSLVQRRVAVQSE